MATKRINASKPKQQANNAKQNKQPKESTKVNQVKQNKKPNQEKQNIEVKEDKKKKRKTSKKKKIIITIFVIIILLAISIGGILYYFHDQEEKYLAYLETIKNNYHSYMVVTKDSKLYDFEYQEVGSVSKNMYLVLDELGDYYQDGYYKLKNNDLYIKYDSVKKTDEKTYDVRYQNYIPFNKSIVTTKDTKMYDGESYYQVDEEQTLPIIIDDNDYYYVIFDNKLVGVSKSEVTTIDNGSNEVGASSVSVLNYHFVINLEAGEAPLCEPADICHTDTQFDSHMKYISENGFYSITMKELEMFIDGKINLPTKSVAVTIDDGWFVYRSIPILEKYNVMGTLFLIGWLAPPTDYSSPNLEVHSHTWNLHNISNCSEGRSPLLCYDKNIIVEDLKKSRESLNNTPYFCYPFYDYNDHAIEALKEAGFTMALTGGDKKVTRGIDKYKVPRYVVVNTTTVNQLANMIN